MGATATVSSSRAGVWEPQPRRRLSLWNGRKLRVLDIVPVDEEGSPFVGFLRVEPVD